MANLRDKVNVEMENISATLEELGKIKDKPNKNQVELAGIAAFLHNIYNGMENILKQTLISQAVPIPKSDSWHQDLLTIAAEKKIIHEILKNQLAKYLAFRHFFVHGYGFLLDAKELDPLVENIFNIYASFKKEINSFMQGS